MSKLTSLVPSTSGPLSSAALLSAIDELLPALRSRGRNIASHRSALALLFYEAERTRAFRDWGAKTLGGFLADQGVKRDVLAKYKRAGKSVFDDQQAVYVAFLRAVADGTQRPALRQVSKQSLEPILKKRLVAHEEPAPVEMMMALSSRTIEHATAIGYEGANDEGVSTLRSLDAFLAHCDRAKLLTRKMIAGEAGEVTRAQATRRLKALSVKCFELVALVETSSY